MSTSNIAPLPSMPSSISKVPEMKIENCYLLFYRDKSEPQCQKGFYCIGGMKEAIHRAQLHCVRMGFRFIYVRNLIQSLDAEEIRRNPGVMNTMTSPEGELTHEKELENNAAT